MQGNISQSASKTRSDARFLAISLAILIEPEIIQKHL